VGEDVSACQGPTTRRLLQTGVTVAAPASYSYDILHNGTAVDGELVGASGGVLSLSRDWTAEVHLLSKMAHDNKHTCTAHALNGSV
jgi:hypothetical protein